MQDPFGVYEVSKAEKKATGGRRATGVLFPGIHGAVAGKKGKKLRAAGNELGGQAAGTAASYGIGAGAGRAASAFQAAGSPKKAGVVGTAGALAGLAAGVSATDYGVRRAQRKGHFKRQKKDSL